MDYNVDAYLQGQQEKESLNTVITAVHKVTKEQVICVWALSADFKQLNKIVELSVNVTTNLNRSTRICDLR